MDVVHPRCCGLDIHKKRVVACLLTSLADGAVQKEIRTFGTMTADLEALAAWLTAVDCQHVAMESTGVYWKPLYNVLEDRFTLLLANARHLKAVPGRKTDVKDSEWIAQLLRHGLVQGSFVPTREQRELRELTRYRTTLVQERTAVVNRLHKTLEGANVKLGSVASDIVGQSGRAILQALLAGTTEAAALAGLAQGRLREKLPELERALTGSLGAHQRFLLARELAHLDFLDAQIAAVSAEVEQRLRPFETAVALLDTLPGIGRRTAEILIAEMGTHLERFGSAKRLAKWAGLAPGNDESGGKRRRAPTTPGSPALRTALVEAAWAASRKRDCSVAAKYHQLAARIGKPKAAVAIAHLLLRLAYLVLTRGTIYQEHRAGVPRPAPPSAPEREVRTLVRRLAKLGYTATLTPTEPAA
jgi:transposase